MNETFAEAFPYGQTAEEMVTAWLESRGWKVTNAGVILQEGKGPRLVFGEEVLIAPDRYGVKCIEGHDVKLWFEIKRKDVFTWHYMSGTWQDGIDVHVYEHYLKIQEYTCEGVIVLFYHDNTATAPRDVHNGAPVSCPTGLYGRGLDYLVKHEHHRDSYERRDYCRPMVYWTIDELRLMATCEEVLQAYQQSR